MTNEELIAKIKAEVERLQDIYADAAKDILAGLVSWNNKHAVQEDVKLAINYADELVKQFKLLA